MKLPKELQKEEVEAGIRAALEKEKIELYGNSKIFVPFLRLNPKLRQSIFCARAAGELILGFEAIDRVLTNEQHGLQKVDNRSDRVSRLLIATNDGSPRFYRELEFLQKRQGDRLLIVRLDMEPPAMGALLGLPEKSIKAILVNRKKSLLNILKSL